MGDPNLLTHLIREHKVHGSELWPDMVRQHDRLHDISSSSAQILIFKSAEQALTNLTNCLEQMSKGAPPLTGREIWKDEMEAIEKWIESRQKAVSGESASLDPAHFA